MPSAVPRGVNHPVSTRSFRLLLLRIALVCAVASSCLGAGELRGQARAGSDGWNDARTREIVRQAIESRRTGRDNDLERFSAYAEGQVHYLAEYGEGVRDQIVRSDRIALELRWRRGVGSLQTLVGRRHANWLPTSVQYHVDHLSLVVENFGDRIHIGDGDEVRDVLNPVAPGAGDVYEYRLVDSLSMLVNDRLTELYRLNVRPLHEDSAGVVGTIDIERESFAVVRLAVTFTPSSYVDPTVRSVSVDLQNALVSNRVWLPAEQHTEVRRQLRFLEMPFGGTIRSSFEVLSWDLDPSTEEWIPAGHRVRAVPAHDLVRYAGWRTWDPDGAPEIMRADSALFEDIRGEAVRVAKGRYLGGTSRLRVRIPSVSSLVRVRRAEGLFAGLGAAFDLDGHWSTTAQAGYAFGAERAELTADVTGRYGQLQFGLEGWFDRPADIGPWSAASGLISTGGALFAGDDYLDPFYESGGRLWIRLPAYGGTATLALATGDHEPAAVHLDPLGGSEPRPIVPAVPGRDTRVEVGWSRQLGGLVGSRLHGHVDVQLAALGDFDYTRWRVEIAAIPAEPDHGWAWEGRAGLGVVTGNQPVQRSLRIGGRGTVPGYGFRQFNGERAAFVHVAVSRPLLHPLIRLRALGALGWSHAGDEAVMLPAAGAAEPVEWRTPDTGGLRPSLGGGVSLIYDLVRIDVARGLDDGVWEWAVSVNPQFREPL